MATQAWAITGNSGTVSANNFLGTTDNQPLVIKTGGVEHVRVDTSGNVAVSGGIVAGGSIEASRAQYSARAKRPTPFLSGT